MVSAGHQGLNPNSFICRELRVALYLFNVSNVRAQLNLPRITLEQNQIDLFEEGDYLREIFSKLEIITVDPDQTLDADKKAPQGPCVPYWRLP